MIEIKNVSKSFDSKVVLSNFSLKIEDGERVALMGESGSGKTTILNIVAGLIKPDGGTVSGVKNKTIGVVFQEDRLVEQLTVYRNIKLVCGNISKTMLGKHLERVGLDKELVNERVSNLSGGMKRRISILRAILSSCDVLLMDEPTKGLDDDNKQAVIDYILEKTNGVSIIWVTHDKSEAEQVSQRIIYL